MAKDHSLLYAGVSPSVPLDDAGETDEITEQDEQIVRGASYLDELVQWLTEYEDELLDPGAGQVLSAEARLAKVEVVRQLKVKVQVDMADTRRKLSA